jgi:hypothetical protein
MNETLNSLLAGKVIKNMTVYTSDNDNGVLEIETEDGSKLTITAWAVDDVGGTRLVIDTKTVAEHSFSS